MATTIGPGPVFGSLILSGAPGFVFSMAGTPPSLTLYAGRVRLTNLDTATHTVSLWIIPPGETDTNSNKVVNSKAIAASDFIDVDLPIMGVNYQLYGAADADAVVTISSLAGIYFS